MIPFSAMRGSEKDHLMVNGNYQGGYKPNGYSKEGDFPQLTYVFNFICASRQGCTSCNAVIKMYGVHLLLEGKSSTFSFANDRPVDSFIARLATGKNEAALVVF